MGEMFAKFIFTASVIMRGITTILLFAIAILTNIAK